MVCLEDTLQVWDLLFNLPVSIILCGIPLYYDPHLKQTEKMMKKCRIASRKSQLALWQAEWVKMELQKIYPDLVVEIISPTDKYTDINIKVDTYLADGVKLIWIIDPQRQTIAVYDGSDVANTLRTDDTLTGGTTLPNFEVAVKDIFS